MNDDNDMGWCVGLVASIAVIPLLVAFGLASLRYLFNPEYYALIRIMELFK